MLMELPSAPESDDVSKPSHADVALKDALDISSPDNPEQHTLRSPLDDLSSEGKVLSEPEVSPLRESGSPISQLRVESPIVDDGASVSTPSAPLAVFGRSARWRQILLGAKNASVEDSASKKFSFWAESLDEPNQRVIRADCERTRADVEYFRRHAVRSKMEAMLTCWCQHQATRYKQGLNEVLAIFIFLQNEENEGEPLSDDDVFALFSAFLKRFVPFYDTDDFVPLQCTFVFFGRLLLYHRPDLHNLLEDRGVSPDMYSMPWFLTLFASKTPLKLALHLWDRFLERSDTTFFMFLGVALLSNAEQAVFSADPSSLPEILTSLSLSSREELENLWIVATRLSDTTPLTFVARLKRSVMRRGAPTRKPSTNAPNVNNKSSLQDISTSDETSVGVAALESTASTHSAKEPPHQAEDPTSETHPALRTGPTFFERLEQEKCFFILPEEVVGHCYCSRLPTAIEKRHPWQPSPLSAWRLIVLDLRPKRWFDAERIPAALHFDPFAPAHQNRGGLVSDGPWAAGKRLLQWSLEPIGGLEAASVFEALKATLGEDWICNRETHICLLGASDDPSLVRSIYELLTTQLTLRHVSVASGGFEAVADFARKQKLEIICSSLDPLAPARNSGVAGVLANAGAAIGLDGSGAQVAKGNIGGVGSAAAAIADGKWSKLTSAWTSIKKAAIPGAVTATSASNTGGTDPRLPSGLPAAGTSPAQQLAGGDSDYNVTGVDAVQPSLRDRPGNWPTSINMAILLRRPLEDICIPGLHWTCLALSIPCPGTALEGVPVIPTRGSPAWSGCHSILAIVRGRLVCALGKDGSVLADVGVEHVLKVTSKKLMPEVLIFYFRATSKQPAMVIFFPGGLQDTQGFVQTLQGNYPQGAA